MRLFEEIAKHVLTRRINGGERPSGSCCSLLAGGFFSQFLLLIVKENIYSRDIVGNAPSRPQMSLSMKINEKNCRPDYFGVLKRSTLLRRFPNAHRNPLGVRSTKGLH
jgi:hypothetical protein